MLLLRPPLSDTAFTEVPLTQQIDEVWLITVIPIHLIIVYHARAERTKIMHLPLPSCT